MNEIFCVLNFTTQYKNALIFSIFIYQYHQIHSIQQGDPVKREKGKKNINDDVGGVHEQLARVKEIVENAFYKRHFYEKLSIKVTHSL